MDIREHLLGRGLDPDRYSVLLDPVGCIATFLLWNLSGQLCGFQQYNPNGTKSIRNDEKHRSLLRYFTFAGDEGDGRRAGRKRLVVWGLESLSPGDSTLFVTEGIFDAVRLHNAGLPAVAVLANDPQHLAPWLRALGRRTVAICDRDPAGGRLARACDAHLIVPGPHHDLGGMTGAEVEAWLSMVL